jgi:hypothetical protein
MVSYEEKKVLWHFDLLRCISMETIETFLDEQLPECFEA